MNLKVAIIGCGKIADEHLDVIQRTPGAQLCAVCDREELMARQLAERSRGAKPYADAEQMLREAQPSVVHITTPPRGHYPLARLCLEHRASVFLEKPFAVTAAEAEDLLRLADERKLQVTAGHNHQLNDVAVEMRRLIQAGFLGGPPVHMESTFCYNLGSGQYARSLLGDKNHWVRALPGGLMHNTISHGVCKIAEYLAGEHPQVIVHGHVSPTLRAIGEFAIIDELRAIIIDENGTTAYFTFSSQIKPGRHEFRVFGPDNFLIADHAHQTLLRGIGRSYKSYLNQFLPPLQYGVRHAAGGLRNVGRFLTNRFPNDLGRRRLVAALYRAVAEGGPPPISHHEILLTTRIMDAIFSQLRAPAAAGVEAQDHAAGTTRAGAPKSS